MAPQPPPSDRRRKWHGRASSPPGRRDLAQWGRPDSNQRPPSSVLRRPWCSDHLSYFPGSDLTSFRGQDSYRDHDTRSLQQRQRRHVLPDVLLSSWGEADSHQRAVVGRVGLVDLHVARSAQREAPRELRELGLVPTRQNDDVGAGRQVSRARLPRRMGDLSGLDASRQIGSHDDVVVEDVSQTGAIATCSGEWDRIRRLSRVTSREVRRRPWRRGDRTRAVPKRALP